jgi:AcrR family transcriptional regulator
LSKQSPARPTPEDVLDSPRGRRATEARLLTAALKLLERDGILGGLNLQEVADEAGVNRGNIYLYFGSRRAMLRQALASGAEMLREALADERGFPFVTRRRRRFRLLADGAEGVRILALLAIDGDEEFRLMPLIEESRADLERDRRQGELDPDADIDAVHVVPFATMLGYAIFREAFARELDTSADELDDRAEAVFARMLEGLAPRRRRKRRRGSRR